MSNSNLVSYTKLSPNCSKRTAAITKITIHHAAGNASIETMGRIFAATSRQASANYGIGTDGRVGMYVEECNRAWTSSNRENDNAAITIEVANYKGAPNWEVSDKALATLINLCVDICQRNGIKELNYTGDKSGNLTRHNMFAATTCPGAYLQSKFPYIAEEVNKRLKPVVVEKPKEEKQIYRVRKTWADAKSQIGAFTNLAYAKRLADNRSGYFVFNQKGVAIYPEVINKVEKPKEEPLKVGDKVKLKPGATYYNGLTVPNWVFRKTLYVREIRGDRVVISTLASGAITGAVSKAYLIKG